VIGFSLWDGPSEKEKKGEKVKKEIRNFLVGFVVSAVGVFAMYSLVLGNEQPEDPAGFCALVQGDWAEAGEYSTSSCPQGLQQQGGQCFERPVGTDNGPDFLTRPYGEGGPLLSHVFGEVYEEIAYECAPVEGSRTVTYARCCGK